MTDSASANLRFTLDLALAKQWAAILAEVSSLPNCEDEWEALRAFARDRALEVREAGRQRAIASLKAAGAQVPADFGLPCNELFVFGERAGPVQ